MQYALPLPEFSSCPDAGDVGLGRAAPSLLAEINRVVYKHPEAGWVSSKIVERDDDSGEPRTHQGF